MQAPPTSRRLAPVVAVVVVTLVIFLLASFLAPDARAQPGPASRPQTVLMGSSD